MHKVLVLFYFLALCQACGQATSQSKEKNVPTQKEEVFPIQTINPSGKTVQTRFNIPLHYQRLPKDSSSFECYLRLLPLKEHNAKVTFYNGKIKPNNEVYDAVVDLPIGKRDLHQCADAVIRLRADYLYQQEKYDSITFNFTNGFKANYGNWRQGKRISVAGNQVRWRQNAQPSDAPENFWKYLEMVFSYAGTASLSKELKPVALDEMRIGDVFIKGGFPGHAVIVVDMAVNETTNDKIFLLAQSYMPAQEIQILKNLNNDTLSAWYSISEISNVLRTPEWTFKTTDLKRFK